MLVGCGSLPPAPDEALVAGGSPVRLRCVGDWDDLGAAMIKAETAGEVDTLKRREEGPDRVIFEVRSINQELGTLTVTRDRSGGPDAKGSWPIELVARIGPRGNARREAALVNGFKIRLEELAGVDSAPSTWN